MGSSDRYFSEIIFHSLVGWAVFLAGISISYFWSLSKAKEFQKK